MDDNQELNPELTEEEEDFTPVYLFLGFLEAGKTKFVQEALDDPKFMSGDRTLLIVCEEGEEEYDLSGFKDGEVTVQTADDPADLTPEQLSEWAEAAKADRVIIEYNGMWQVKELFANLPESWGVYQVVTVVDSTTFLQYNTNMRSLVVDKFGVSEMVCFNRFAEGMSVQEFHQIVRGVSRRIEIYYETPDGKTMYDDLEDPLPFDVNAAHIVIDDRDFALFFRDLMEETEKYSGKTVTFRGRAVSNPTFPKNVFAVGRHIMTCCVEDIQYCWIGATYEKRFDPKQQSWIMVTGRILLRQDRAAGRVVPILQVKKLAPADPPEQEVATFY